MVQNVWNEYRCLLNCLNVQRRVGKHIGRLLRLTDGPGVDPTYGVVDTRRLSKLQGWDGTTNAVWNGGKAAAPKGSKS